MRSIVSIMTILILASLLSAVYVSMACFRFYKKVWPFLEGFWVLISHMLGKVYFLSLQMEQLGLIRKFCFSISSIHILSGMVRNCSYILGTEEVRIN
jgi:hypothetical protein